jgi:hypothetical protein
MLSKIAGNNDLCEGWNMIRPYGLGFITQPCTISGENIRDSITCPLAETEFEGNKIQEQRLLYLLEDTIRATVIFLSVDFLD